MVISWNVSNNFLINVFYFVCINYYYCLVEESTKNIVKTAALAVGSLKEMEFDIRFNPDVYSPGIRHCENIDPALEKQKQLVKDAADFLHTVQIPTFVCILYYLVLVLYLTKSKILTRFLLLFRLEIV